MPSGQSKYSYNSNPWADDEGVEVIEGKVSGEPLLKGSRVPARLVEECLDAGETIEEISYNYGLRRADVLRFKLYVDRHQPPINA